MTARCAPGRFTLAFRQCVHILSLFINNEHGNIVNMARRRRVLHPEPYEPAIGRWIPHAELRPVGDLARFDGILTGRAAGRTVRYLVEERRHLRHQDVGVVIDQLNRRRAELPRKHAADRILLLAPHVRPQQAEALERTGIDYLDLAGNAHLTAGGLFVHVEGRKPPKEAPGALERPQRGWIKAVMAILIRPDLADAPFRMLAKDADVALGTVARCMNDLARRGLLLDRKDGRTIADRQTLVALWVQAYVEALRPRLKERRFQVHADGKAQLRDRLRAVLAGRGQPWALTGADAAERLTHFFRAEETEIYAPPEVFDDRDTQRALIAQPAARGGNLLVIEPPGPLAIPNAVIGETVPAAPVILAYAELRYRGTGQALEAAGLLLPEVLGHATD